MPSPAVTTVSKPLSMDDDAGSLVEVGDLVTIRYDDTPNRPIRIRLSRTQHDPAGGTIHISEPLGIAALGSSVDDEIEVIIGGAARTAVIERIEKGAIASQQLQHAEMET